MVTIDWQQTATVTTPKIARTAKHDEDRGHFLAPAGHLYLAPSPSLPQTNHTVSATKLHHRDAGERGRRLTQNALL